MNYKPTRIGLLNFWLYDDEEFDFADGKLLLRGENGSGKSVTMQSFIPLILDGNKSPKRLDPFGSTDKHIEAYLLGGYDTEQKDEATGYLYMEFYEEQLLKYVTIGMGLHAKKGRPVDFWGFAITDGRRVNRDIFLYKNRIQKVPLSKNELRAELGVANTLVDTTKDYKKMVNNLLFGFQNIEDYDEFINVLIQLRSPKLSKDYKPTVLMGILSKVLQPLTDEDLRPLSDAVEEMDNTKEKIEQLKKHLKQLTYLMQSYRNYNESILYKKAHNFKESMKSVEKSSDELAETEKTIASSKTRIDEIDKNLSELEVELEASKKSRAELDSKDLESNIEKVRELAASIEKLNDEIANWTNKQEEQENKKIDTEKKKKLYEDEYATLEKRIEKTLGHIDSMCREVAFTEPLILLKDFQNDFQSEIDFESVIQRTRTYRQKLSQVLSKLKEKTVKECSLGEIEAELESLNKEQGELLRELEAHQASLDEALQTMRDEILVLGKTNRYVKLSEDDKKKLLEPTINFSKKSYEEAKNYYGRLADVYYKESNREFYQIDGKLKSITDSIKELSIELETLKNQKEVKIVLDNEEESTAVFLKEQNIPHIQFYKAVEFKENLSKSARDTLESTLLKAGLLSAFIIGAKDLKMLKGHKGTFVIPGKKKKNNLSTYFDCATGIDFDKKTVQEVLESLSTDDAELISFDDKSYKLDNIYGYGSQSEPQKYIGILAREQAHKKKIAEKEEEIKAQENAKNQLEQMKEKKASELKEIEHEKTLFPSEAKAEEILSKEDKAEIKLEINKKNMAAVEEKKTALNELLGNLYRQINDYKDTIALPLSEDAIEEAVTSTTILVDEIDDLKGDYQLLIQNRENEQLIKDRLEELEEAITEIYLKIDDNKKAIKKFETTKSNIEEILNSDETKKLSTLLRTLNEKIDKIPQRQGDLRQEKGTILSDLLSFEEKLQSLQNTHVLKEREMKIFKDIFRKEYDLNYVFEDDGEDVSLANAVINKLQSKKDADASVLYENFVDNYNKYRNELAEYKLSYKTIFENTESDEQLKAVYDTGTRKDYSAIYQGRTMNLFSLEKELNDSINENEQIISDQDRNLFEEILLKTVGNKIRDHIDDAKKWVKSINQIMKDMQTSSALSFQLEWHPKDKESMDEIDTRELISLFNISPDIIKRSDSDKLIKHFRSKLKSRIDEETHESYSDIIFEILDYRTWFEFKMYYIRAGENRRELTDKIFSVFSGGEKAKTMYLPLFTAVCAKLQSAKETAPRLVALDEAFAGVDDANIREMFGIMDSLNLDYILTSQALWGDFDTIKELGISELLRPNNSSVVGIRRYHWNGHVKEVVQKKVLNDESLDIF